jgi:ferredoxin
VAKRKIIKIDEKKCNGCGQCIPNCPEGAIQIIDGKARLVSDLFCDGLGACLGYCPEGAISTEEREAAPYDERKVMENIISQGEGVIRAHLVHLSQHNEQGYLRQAQAYLKEKGIQASVMQELQTKNCVCPGSKVMDLREDKEYAEEPGIKEVSSALGNWPVQLRLVPEQAPYLAGAELLIAADCVPFSYAAFHQDLLKGKILLIACPKLDDLQYYQEKLTTIFKNNEIKSLACAHMEVPCCFGLPKIVKDALKLSGKDIPFKDITVSIKGEILE